MAARTPARNKAAMGHLKAKREPLHRMGIRPAVPHVDSRDEPVPGRGHRARQLRPSACASVRPSGISTDASRRCYLVVLVVSGLDRYSMGVEENRSQLVAALARVAGGDRAALQIVYRDTSAKLFGVCLRILNDRSEAEDVLQEVYLTVWRKAASFDPARASPITWLVAIARNRSIDRLRATAGGRRMEPIDAAE